MIHDKDYMMRQVRQLSELLSQLFLGKNEGLSTEETAEHLDSQLRSIFKKDWPQISLLKTEEILDLISEKEAKDQADYFQLLGNLFYLKANEAQKPEFYAAAKTFYENYLQKSGIYSLEIVGRLAEISKKIK